MISPIITSSINRLKYSFGGMAVSLISEDLIKNPATGQLGAYIMVEGVKAFLPCQIAEEISSTPYGQSIADDFIYQTLNERKADYDNVNNQLNS